MAVPAGCVRIDSALGELPQAIFGEGVRLEFAARVRLGRKGRVAAVWPRQSRRRMRLIGR